MSRCRCSKVSQQPPQPSLLSGTGLSGPDLLVPQPPLLCSLLPPAALHRLFQAATLWLVASGQYIPWDGTHCGVACAVIAGHMVQDPPPCCVSPVEIFDFAVGHPSTPASLRFSPSSRILGLEADRGYFHRVVPCESFSTSQGGYDVRCAHSACDGIEPNLTAAVSGEDFGRKPWFECTRVVCGL